MGQNLTGQTIASTYEDLVQISGSSRNFLTDGTGSNITSLAVTASNAVSSSYALTASYAANVSSPFPYTGSAGISGSLSVDGNVNIDNGTLNLQGTPGVATITFQNVGGAGDLTISQNDAIPQTLTLDKFNTLTSTTNLDITGSFRNAAFTGRVTATSFTGSLQGTASFADNATSSSYAVTASYALNAGGADTGSLMVTGSATNNVLTFTKGDGSTFNLTVATGSAATVNTGSLMVTGSVSSNTLTFTKGDGSTFNLTVATGSAVTVNTGSLLVTASISNATTTYTKGDGSTFSLTTNNVVNANSASVATSASYATTASFALTAATASYLNTGFYATASFSGSTWTFNHNLNASYVVIECYDVNGEEIIPQTIDLTSVNTATITFPVIVEGVALASLGNGIVSGKDPVSVYSSQQSLGTTTYVQKLDITTATIHTIHISASGLHWIDATQLASGTGASVNAYWYPESLTNVGDQAMVMFTVNSGSAAAITYRALTSASAAFGYYAGGVTVGAANITVSRQTNVNQRNFGNSTTVATIMTKTADGVYLGGNMLPIAAASYIFSGSQGTPI
jgi:hypothetical protein